MTCPVVGSAIEPDSQDQQLEKHLPRNMSFNVGWEGSRRILIPLADGVELHGVKACAVACNSDGTRTMTIELELE
jgi:hypothetical protein